MIHGYHLVMVTYGSWLPNNPRGSWSDFVASWELYKKKKSAPPSEIPPSLHENPRLLKQRRDAQQALKLPPVILNGIRSRAVGGGFAEQVRKSKLIFWACSILPEHVHLVIARGPLPIERIAHPWFVNWPTQPLLRMGQSILHYCHKNPSRRCPNRRRCCAGAQQNLPQVHHRRSCFHARLDAQAVHSRSGKRNFAERFSDKVLPVACVFDRVMQTGFGYLVVPRIELDIDRAPSLTLPTSLQDLNVELARLLDLEIPVDLVAGVGPITHGAFFRVGFPAQIDALYD